MARFLVALFCIFCAADGERLAQRVSVKSQGSAVQKIIEMLGEMKAKVEADIDAETKSMEEFMSYCDDGSKEKEYAIKTASRQIEELQATIEDASAQISELTDEVATLGTEISTKEKELSDATSIRETEHADFKKVEGELVKSLDQLTRAIAEVKKGMSFVQGKGQKKQMKKILSAITTIVESALVTGQQKRSLKSFLQSTSDRDEPDFSIRGAMLAQQPQAKAYESSSGGIMDILDETKDKAEKELSDCRKAEMEASHEFEMVKQSLENEISTKKEKLAEASAGKATNAEAKGSAEGELTNTKKTKSEDSAYLSTLKSDCQAKAMEWEERLKSAKGEMGAIDKAKEILSEGVKALVQVSARRSTIRSHSRFLTSTNFDDDDDSEEDDRRQRVVDKLKELGGTYRSFALTQLGNRAKSDPMAKVKGLIEEMISKLMSEAAEEANQKAFCDEEMGKSKKAQQTKTMKLDKLTARIDSFSTKRLQLLEDIKTLESEVSDIDRSQAEATKIRQEEHAEFQKAQSDYSSSENACAQAVEVLKQYYEGSSLLQISSTSRRSSSDAAPSFGGAQSDAGSTIIQFLEVAEEDFARLLAEVETSEDNAQKAYDKLSQENKVSKATKATEAKGKNSEVKSISASLADYTDDKTGLSKELDAVAAYIEKLRPECESKAMSAEERIAARKAEIEGLKEALQILEAPR